MLSVLFIAACSKPQAEIVKHAFSLKTTRVSLETGKTCQVYYDYVKITGTKYEKCDYDFVGNPAGLQFFSSDESVATVSPQGEVKGIAPGLSLITAKAKGVDVKGTFTVAVEKAGNGDYDFTKDLSTPLTQANIFMPLGLNNKTLQGMDIDKAGNIYMTWEENTYVHLRCFPKGSTTNCPADMILPVSGHGDGFCVEQDKDECYFWMPGSLGEPASNGGYSGAVATVEGVRLICRFKYDAGKTLYPEDAVERYYVNDNGCRIVDVDTEHDVMACWCYENGKEYIRIYKFSDIKKGSKVTKYVTRVHNKGQAIEAYDLNTVREIAKFTWNRKEICGVDGTSTKAIQGFCVYKDKVYVSAGVKNDPATTITVVDFNGKILQKMVPFGLTSDKQKLIQLNLSSDGSFEPEGMHIRKGVLYHGFAGDYPTTGSKKHCCILAL